MTTFKQKALEALKSMENDGDNCFEDTVAHCISRIEAIEESESIDYNKASLEANATLSKFIHMKI